MPPQANCTPSPPPACPESPRLPANGSSEQGKHHGEPEAVYLNSYGPCVSLRLLPGLEQDGVMCAFYLSVAEEPVSRWLYLHQSHLFMQREDCVTSLQVNVFCKPWELLLKKRSWAIFHVQSNVWCVHSCCGLACESILKGRLPFPIFSPF